jgi:hypothetical protein
MRAAPLLLASLALAAALLGVAVLADAQPDYAFEDKLECRAIMRFKACSRHIDMSPPNALGIAGTVVDAKRLSRWRTRLKVDVVRATQPIGKSVEFDVMACYHWDGKIGDPINVVVESRIDPHHGAFQLHPSCNT